MNIQVGDLIEEADGSLSIITKIKLGRTTGKEYAECEFIINENDGDPLWSMGVEEITKQKPQWTRSPTLFCIIFATFQMHFKL